MTEPDLDLLPEDQEAADAMSIEEEEAADADDAESEEPDADEGDDVTDADATL
jgi:hypothetical protein